MKNTWQKGSAMLIVCAMLASVLVALVSVPVVSADTEVVTGGLDIVFDTTFMQDEMVWMSNNAGTNPYNLGEGDGLDDDAVTVDSCELRITVHNTDTADAANDFYINITAFGATGVFDFEDTVAGTAGLQVSVGPLVVAADGTNNFDFNFDVLATNIALGSSTDTAITITWDYLDDNGGTPQSVTGNKVGHIYLSSIFDDPANDPDEQLSNMDDATGGGDDARFEAGDSFEAATLNLSNYDGDDITDLTCTIVPPSPITFSNGINYCIMTDGITAGWYEDANYRVNVPAGTTPDIYPGTASITYTRDDSDLTVTENNLGVDFEVDFNFRDTDPVSPNTVDTNISIYQVTTTGVLIVEEVLDNGTRLYENAIPAYDIPHFDQSTYTDEVIMIEITLENNANHPLYNVEFQIDPTAGPWAFFRNPQFFWAEDGVSYFDDLTLFVDLLPVDGTVTFIVSLIVANDIPIGEHRLPITYNGFWFDTGELDEPTGFFQTNGGDDLLAVFSVFVDDLEIACHSVVTPPGAAAPGDKSDITANDITIAIHNDEGYDFIDVTVQADFTGTPWSHPIDGTALVWANGANPATPQDTWNTGTSFNAVFTVDTDYNIDPERFPFVLTITAVINKTLVVVTTTIDQTRGAFIDFTGYGPRIFIEAFTADSIVPGEPFDIEFTIVNQGDDTARDIWIQFEQDGTDLYETWDFEKAFKEQFDWDGMIDGWFENATEFNDYSWEHFPTELFYTMESLDVDNIKEIVEINLYADGVYRDPDAIMQWLYVDEIAPGENITITMTFLADKDMVNGKSYEIEISLTGIDSENAAFTQAAWDIAVMSSLPGDSYNPVEMDWFDTGVKALALLLFLIIVLAILLFVLNKFKGEGDEYDDEDEFDFEDEEEDDFEFEPKAEPEPVETPEPAAEELIEP